MASASPDDAITPPGTDGGTAVPEQRALSVVVIAEKPSVARDLARVLRASRKAQGYLEGNGYRVTWALGHLVRLAEPDDYGPPWKGRWSRAQLPMIPDPWRLEVTAKMADQFQVVRGLITDPATRRLVCATDAGREGELILRLIYEQARCTKPFDRLWVSSLTDETIRAGLRSLKPGSAYDDLARAARARAQADWLMIGMNLTRADTVRNGVLCTIGRVQTPTLAMIVARDAEIAAFKATPFYELVAHVREGFQAIYLKDGKTRIPGREEAERFLALLAPHRIGTVQGLDRQGRREPPPPLYDLTALQRDANQRLRLTAAQVLELAQTLYETHKLLSYPRTECRHIGEDLVPELPRILRGLDHPQAQWALERLASGHRLGRAYVDRTKLTDHHAILPTGQPAPRVWGVRCGSCTIWSKPVSCAASCPTKWWRRPGSTWRSGARGSSHEVVGSWSPAGESPTHHRYARPPRRGRPPRAPLGMDRRSSQPQVATRPCRPWSRVRRWGSSDSSSGRGRPARPAPIAAPACSPP